ncbi:MAG: glycosyltransferase [Bacteroidales bacterium]
MGFADAYLARQGRVPLIGEPPSPELRCIAVIPAYKEDQLHRTLFSLKNQQAFGGTAEVIVLVNAPEDAPEALVRSSEELTRDCRAVFASTSRDRIHFHILPLQLLPKKDAGVGLARKIGMDEAVHRFNLLNKPGGLIISCDADAIYEESYLNGLVRHFANNPLTPACSVYYEHSFGPEYSPEINSAIIQYELYLRYYLLGLRFAGHPHAFHTIGSSFGVRGDVYCRQGGMNKRKAGEDFYFLQKVIQPGNFTELNSVKVILSPRPSDRVPFGTGAAVAKIVSPGQGRWMTYQPEAFLQLKKFIKVIHEGIPSLERAIEADGELISSPLVSFLQESGIREALTEIRANTAGEEAFRKRFFTWFNAFKVLKYMNFCHEGHYERMFVSSCTRKLLGICGISEKSLPPDDEGLLLFLRQLERQSGFYNLPIGR